MARLADAGGGAAARSPRRLQLRARALDQAGAAQVQGRADLPAGAAKRALYEVLRERLLAAGYQEIGIDHFALPHDALAVAAAAGTLHRNFMGYTDRRTTALLGLGVSAISETPTCFHQNEKVITVYERRVARRRDPDTARAQSCRTTIAGAPIAFDR